MKQVDFINGERPAEPFRDIRNTRPSTAEEKALLCLILGRLCNTVPTSVLGGSINLSRDWLREQAHARKMLRNTRASVIDLSSCIATLERYKRDVSGS